MFLFSILSPLKKKHQNESELRNPNIFRLRWLSVVFVFRLEQSAYYDISTTALHSCFERPPGQQVHLICMWGGAVAAWRRVHGYQNMPLSFIDDCYSKQAAVA